MCAAHAMACVEFGGQVVSWFSPSTMGIQTWCQTCSLSEAILMMPEIFADSIFYLKTFVMIYKNQKTIITALQGIAVLLISQKTIHFLVFCFDCR